MAGFMIPEHCYFCGQINGRPDQDLIAQLLPAEKYVRRVMLETADFAVIPSLGPLTDGHALLCVKDHVRSFSALDPGLQDEYETIKRQLRQTQKELYGGEALVFEHGMSSHGHRVPCTVDHAHMHFVPLCGVKESEVIPALNWRKFDGSIAALNRLSGGREYLLVDTGDGVSRIATQGAEGFESQLMRKAIAAQNGRPRDWNWREEPAAAAAHAAWQRFSLRPALG
jgi:diadenosine tetraphosphate (Ap4A) HIT family hydrolase